MHASNPAQVHHQGVDLLGTNHPQYAGNQSSASPHNPNTPYPFNLERFYSKSEAPWDPIHAGQSAQVGGGGYNTSLPAFQNFRGRGLPSECDTCPEDSAYGGSRVPQSIENASAYEGDTNPDAHNTAVLMEAFHMGPQTIPSNQIPSSWPSSQPPLSSTGENKNFCPECDTFLRTKSELKKHHLRHEKPFRCDVPRCNRTKGFGTRNDLDRHKRSVHSDLTVSGSCYVCPFDQCASRDPAKIWPRADNFRSHLRRIHNKDLTADADLEEYTYHDAQVPSQPTLRADLQGVGGGGLSYMIPPPSTNMQRPVGSSYPAAYLGPQPMDTSQDIGEEFESLLQDANSSENAQPSRDSSRACQSFEQSINSTEGSLQSSQQVNARPAPFSIALFPNQNGSQRQVQGGSVVSVSSDEEDDPFDTVAEPPQHESDGDGPLETNTARPSEQPRLTAPPTEPKKAGSSINVPSDLEDVYKQVRSEPPETVVAYLKLFSKDLLTRALSDGTDDGKSSGSSQESTSQKSAHPCPQCTKTFNRQCELKKHLKRHEKPYGCTFRDCSKSFGSKNDWKRHESSQHWQLETWKCEEMDSDQSEPCGRVCQRRESFRLHLIKDHEIKESKALEEKFEKCRLGRHCKKSFWCGFCEKIQVIEEEGANAWTKRCNHIDDHFCGRIGPKKSIKKWKHPSGDDEQADQDSSVSSTTASTKQSGSSPDPISSSSSTSSSSPAAGSRTPSIGKRKTKVDGDGAPRKKTRKETTFMWNCCGCRMQNNFKLSPMCSDCNHAKCDGCSYCPTNEQQEGRGEYDATISSGGM